MHRLTFLIANGATYFKTMVELIKQNIAAFISCVSASVEEVMLTDFWSVILAKFSLEVVCEFANSFETCCLRRL